MYRLIVATCTIAVWVGSAQAQVVPGDSPNMGIGAAVSSSRSRPLLGISSPSSQYRSGDDSSSNKKGAANAAGRKPANDPWASIRPTPGAAAPDRHRVE